MRFLGRFEGIHQRLGALEQRLTGNHAAAEARMDAACQDLRAEITALSRVIKDALTEESAADAAARGDLAARMNALHDALADQAGVTTAANATQLAQLAERIDRMAAMLGDRLAAEREATVEVLRSLGSADLGHSAELATRAHVDAALQSLSEALRGEHQALLRTLQGTREVAAEPPAAPEKRPLPLPLAGASAPMPPAALPSVYFIVGCGRSGTTSLARILNRASNGVCHNEPAPVLGHESRLAYEGRLDAPFGALQRAIAPRVVEALDRGLCYGEKNLTLPPFIPYLHALFRCRFVYAVRDGRAVVRSWLDWHNQVYGNIFRECPERGPLSPRALAWAARTPAALDEYDVARPRPLADDAWHDAWPSLSRLEMVAWHWARTNTIILDALEKLPTETWRRADYSPMDAGTLMDIAGFLGLEGLDPSEVTAMVDARINRLEDQAPDCRRFPAWESWSDHDKAAFDAIATPTMRRLGYYPPDHIRHRPSDFAESWRPGDEEPSTGLAWLAERLADDRPSSIREACGTGVSELFPKATVSPIAASEWIDAPPSGKADLVIARGNALAGIYDIEAAIRRLATQSARWLFLSFADSGFAEHRHHRDAVTGRYTNAISHRAVESQLTALGWTVAASSDDHGCRVLLARAPGIG